MDVSQAQFARLAAIPRMNEVWRGRAARSKDEQALPRRPAQELNDAGEYLEHGDPFDSHSLNGLL